jgi:outer membrane protein OmpA-like peptidoglycan-associated protein
VKKIIPCSIAVVVAGLAVALTGCDPTSVGGSATAASAGPPVTITQSAAPSALVTMLSGPATDPALAGLVKATVRPHEDLTVLQAGSVPKTVLSAVSPAPSKVVVAGKPAAPKGGTTNYLSAQYNARLKRWRNDIAKAQTTERNRTRATLSAWWQSLELPATVSRMASSSPAAGNLAAESADAASALTGLEATGSVFGSRRVIVLYAEELSGWLPAGELTGDTVIVVTPFLPSGAAASAAQADLLAAGAAQAAVVGPEITGTQLANLVSAGLAQNGLHEWVSPPVLFGNDSATLTPRADTQLAALLPRLKKAGATAIINGFASTPGTAQTNYLLSYSRAAAAASYFESHGIPASSLIIVGHGASDPVAAGNSGQNRRVTVVIEAS